MVPASPLHACTGLAVGARVAGWREQPSAAARLGAIDTISVRRLAVLGLLGLRLFCVLRIHRGVRHLSLGYDAGELSEEGVGDGPSPPSARAGPTLARLNAATAARSMIFMVSRPHLPASLERVRGLFHRIVCDGEEMGFLPLRDNRASWHMIYAHSEAAFVAEFIDWLRQPERGATLTEQPRMGEAKWRAGRGRDPARGEQARARQPRKGETSCGVPLFCASTGRI